MGYRVHTCVAGPVGYGEADHPVPAATEQLGEKIARVLEGVPAGKLLSISHSVGSSNTSNGTGMPYASAVIVVAD